MFLDLTDPFNYFLKKYEKYSIWFFVFSFKESVKLYSKLSKNERISKTCFQETSFIFNF